MENMKHVTGLCALVLALAACAPLSIYYKPGVSLARLEADETQCRVRALRDVPVANRTYQEPTRYIPPRRYCDPSGACEYEPAEWIPGRIVTVDVNAELRARVTRQCMGARGYSPVDIPQCPVGIVAEGRTTTLPRLSAKSCVIRNPDGTFLIVDQA